MFMEKECPITLGVLRGKKERERERDLCTGKPTCHERERERERDEKKAGTPNHHIFFSPTLKED